EIQVRSALQHAWATAVETVGTFTHQSLKSSLGSDEWLRFFTLMGSVIATREDRPIVPGTPTDAVALVAELRELADTLDASNRLRSFGEVVRTLKQPSSGEAEFYLVELDPENKNVKITEFNERQSKQAASEYFDTERLIGETSSDAVLVSVDSIAS